MESSFMSVAALMNIILTQTRHESFVVFSLFSKLNQSAGCTLDWVLNQPVGFWLSVAYASLGVPNSIEDSSNVKMPYSKWNHRLAICYWSIFSWCHFYYILYYVHEDVIKMADSYNINIG